MGMLMYRYALQSVFVRWLLGLASVCWMLAIGWQQAGHAHACALSAGRELRECLTHPPPEGFTAAPPPCRMQASCISPCPSLSPFS